MAQLDFRPAFAEVRELIRNAVMENFQQERSPDGTPWAPLMEYTIVHRKESIEGDAILVDTGNLFRRAVVNPRVTMTLTTMTYAVTGAKYAAKHQAGGYSESGHQVPQRKFLGWNKELIDQTKKIVAKHAAQALKGKLP